MTFDPRTGYPPHYGLAGPSLAKPAPRTTAQLQEQAEAAAKAGESKKTPRIPEHVLDLGTKLLIYFTDGSSEVMDKSRFPAQGPSSDPDLARRQAFEAQENALSRAESARQFNEQFGSNKAQFNTEFPVSEAGLTGYYQGAPTLERERFGETQRQFNLEFPEDQRQYDTTNALAYYRDLMSRAANPRNFMETFFERRGVPAPAGSEAFGNTAGEKPWEIGTFNQFLPQFLASVGAYGTAAAPYRSASSVQSSAPQPVAQSAPVVAQRPTSVTYDVQNQGGTTPQTFNLAQFGGVEPSWLKAAAEGQAVDIDPQEIAAMRKRTNSYDRGGVIGFDPGTSGSESYPPFVGTSIAALIKQMLDGHGLDTGRAMDQLDSWQTVGGVMADRKRASDAQQGRIRGAEKPGDVIPEPVVGVGVNSGQTYTFGEKGPEGVVPTDYLPEFLKQRSGRNGSYAVGGQIGFDDGGYQSPYPPVDEIDLYGGDLYGGPSYSSQPDYGMNYLDPGYVNPIRPKFQKTPGGGLQYPAGIDTQTGQLYDIGAVNQGSSAPAPITPTTQTASQPFQITEDQKRQMREMLEETARRNAEAIAPKAPTVTQQPTTTVPQQNPFTVTPEQQRMIDEEIARTNEENRRRALPPVVPPVVQPGTPGTVPGPNNSVVQQPTFLPQNGQTSAPAPAGAPTMREVSAPGTFGNTVGNSQGFGARPQFLPGEDQTPLDALLSQGRLPPFMARVFGQQAGVHSQGTNRPQRYDLPPEVPVISRLAFLQMTPSERSGWESYISSFGIVPEDYWYMVEELSPQGPRTQLPTFGNQFFTPRQ